MKEYTDTRPPIPSVLLFVLSTEYNRNTVLHDTQPTIDVEPATALESKITEDNIVTINEIG